MASSGWTAEHDAALAEIKKADKDDDYLDELDRVLDNIKVNVAQFI